MASRPLGAPCRWNMGPETELSGVLTLTFEVEQETAQEFEVRRKVGECVLEVQREMFQARGSDRCAWCQ